MAAGVVGGDGELLFAGVLAVVELLEHAAVLGVDDEALVAAADEDAEGRPGEGVGRRGVAADEALRLARVLVLENVSDYGAV